MESVFSLASTFFLVVNPIGNAPTILSLIKTFDLKKQRLILIREGFISLALALFFQYFGERFLSMLNVQSYAISLCGGILLFLVALRMIFSMEEPEEHLNPATDPIIVPIATPLLSGPGLLTIIMLKSRLVENDTVITEAILLAWVGTFAVLASAPYLEKILGKKGMIALEQLMGLTLTMIATEMVVKAFRLFLQQTHGGA